MTQVHFSMSIRLHVYIIKTLELSEVVALLRRDSRSSRVTGVDISVRTSVALTAAFWNESEIVVGWIPVKRSTNCKGCHTPYTNIRTDRLR